MRQQESSLPYRYSLPLAAVFLTLSLLMCAMWCRTWLQGFSQLEGRDWPAFRVPR
jgi:hypothetical protein